MNSQNEHRYVLRVTVADTKQMVELPVHPDWDAAIRWCHLQGIRSGVLPARTVAPQTRVRPVWHSLGAPHVGGFELTLDAAGGASFVADIDAGYVHADIVAALTDFLRDGRVERLDEIAYALCAYPDVAWNRRPENRDDETTLEALDEPLTLAPLSLGPVLEACQRCGTTRSSATDMPFIVPQDVLAECIEASRDAGDIEVGGLLLGRLHQDPETSEIGVIVRAQIPARHTDADQTSLKFTARTWADAGAAISLRNADEQIVGWFHSHPDFCSRCPASRRSSCAYSRPFFSEADRSVHRAAFPGAWSVGLLLSWLGDHDPSVDMFGWHKGRIEAREFHVVSNSIKGVNR